MRRDGRRIDKVVRGVWSCRDDDLLWWDGEWWSVGRLFDLADRTTDVLRNGGFAAGSRLVVFMPNCPALLGLALAVWRLEGTLVPLNPQGGAEALLSAVFHADPTALIVEEAWVSKLSGIEKTAEVPIVALASDGALETYTGTESVPSDSHVAVLFSTSGTTGRPKVVPLTHENILSNLEQSLQLVNILKPCDVFLNVLPNFHTLGLVTSALLPLIAGNRQAVVPIFMPPDRVLRAITAARVTVIVGVPTMLHLMVGAAAKAGSTFDSLRVVLSGGDRFPPALDERVRRVFGVPVLEGYGLTECSPVLAVNPTYERRRLGTVGPLLEKIEAKVLDSDGNSVMLGEEGVLWVRGPSVASGYFKDPEMTEKKFVDGWFNTGDVVVMDDERYVRIVDRASDMIIVGGFNVYPQEVEAILTSHPGVMEAATVGRPNSLSGQVPCAYVSVVPEGPPSPEELIVYCKERLAHYKVPRRIEIVQDFPRNSMGKILRRILREALEEQARQQR
ncbi:MAG: AMP-dependent synthetase [Dethiosulfovibrio peptidovorans]|nr:MAG: AMP-dependent synthetase [Dethiosulfovibrio peptidovorans]